MLSKESMVTAPLMVALYDRAFLFDSLVDAFRSRWRLYLGLAATWLALAALMSTEPHAASIGFDVGLTAWTYLLNQAGMIAEYLRSALWPVSPVFAYGEPRSLTLWDIWPQALLVVSLLALVVWGWVVRPSLTYPAVWFFVILAPTSTVVPIVTEVGAGRRMYLPMAGLVVRCS